MDATQNTDKDLVIFSGTRKNEEGEIGIMRDERRINSIFGKAKRGVIIVGDLFTLSKKNKMWYDLITWANSKRIIMKGEEYYKRMK